MISGVCFQRGIEQPVIDFEFDADITAGWIFFPQISGKAIGNPAIRGIQVDAQAMLVQADLLLPGATEECFEIPFRVIKQTDIGPANFSRQDRGEGMNRQMEQAGFFLETGLDMAFDSPAVWKIVLFEDSVLDLLGKGLCH
ncbi:MAG: hypothetical protein UZ16_OP3001001960 [Candidatus Hinthialibacteria bacterium OLB16]|nr:MAG: hypothetical protein UZ16_OP3001001960 [Candidatus Hinthialibacteria bacterium OLB16]